MTCDLFIEKLRSLNVKVIAFDMDQTAVRAHSMGQLKKEDFNKYADKASDDFLEIIPILIKEGFKIAIATHSDEVEYGDEIHPRTHLLGYHLVDKLLSQLFPIEIKDQFFIVAYNPRRRQDDVNLGKTYHVNKISLHYNVLQREVILFDDDEDNISQTGHLCTSIPVNPDVGFVYFDLLNY